MKRRDNCKMCGIKLDDTPIYTGFCIGCAKKKQKTIVKMLTVCSIVGGILAIAFYEAVRFMQINYNGTYNGTELGFRVYEFFVTMDFYAVNAISLVLFFLPYGIGFDASYLPSINTGVYEGNGFLILLKWVLCTLLAPLLMAYSIFFRKKLNKYIALSEEREPDS